MPGYNKQSFFPNFVLQSLQWKDEHLKTSSIIGIFQSFVNNYSWKHSTHCRIHVQFLHQAKSVKQLEV